MNKFLIPKYEVVKIHRDVYHNSVINIDMITGFKRQNDIVPSALGSYMSNHEKEKCRVYQIVFHGTDLIWSFETEEGRDQAWVLLFDTLNAKRLEEILMENRKSGNL